MVKLVIDNREIEVPKGMKVIEAAERLGIVIPRFCYHPALGAVGACRVCAVKIEGPLKGIHMSCMTDVRDGMAVSTLDPEAVDFRRQVIEWLMMNHPHDCPVCDEGGHCLLQDLTIAGGHSIRRYPGKKRTYRDQYLGVFVQHEMNRCIHCYRCWRFYQGFAGYRDLGCLQIAHHTYFGRVADGPLESPFSGNLNDICPTGVFTDKPSRFFGRRWDFERAPSICIHCSLGCNLVTSCRYRQVVRQEARFHQAVNGYFICDRGRYGFYYESDPARPRSPRVHSQEVSWEKALHAAAEALSRIQAAGPGSVAVLGSGRSSLENLAMLKCLCRLQEWSPPAYFSTRSAARKIEAAVSRLDGRIAVSLREIEGADFILAVGADPMNEAPMLALAMRQGFKNGAGVAPMFPLPLSPTFIQGNPVAVADPRPVSLPLEFTHFPLAPGDLDLFLAVLMKRSLPRSQFEKNGAPALKYFDALPEEYPQGFPSQELLPDLERALRQSRKPVVICGTEVVEDSTIGMAADAALLFKEAKGWAGLFYLLPAANSFGAALLSPGDSLEEILGGIEKGVVKALIVVEADPFRNFPHRERLKAALDQLEFLLVLDYLPSEISRRAHVFFPSTPLFESFSSFVNQEGRVQFTRPVYRGGLPISQTGKGGHPPRVFEAGIPGGESRPAWLVLSELCQDILGTGNELSAAQAVPKRIEDLWRWMSRDNPAFAKVKDPYGEEEVLEGVRIIPEKGKDISLIQPSPPGEAKFLEIHLTDWTFGTEELAGYSRCEQQVEKSPALSMSASDASRLGVRDKDRVRITGDGGTLDVDVAVSADIAAGIMFLPRHRQLNWQIFLELPARIRPERIVKI